jgi:Fic family protein
VTEDRNLAAQGRYGRWETRQWPANPGAPGGRRARRGGSYDAFVPPPIAERGFAFADDTVATIVEASRALGRLAQDPPKLASFEAVARNLLRSEGVASSRIEGLQISHQRLARAVYAEGRPGGDPHAAEVVGNVEALEQAIALGAGAEPFTVEDVQAIHHTLLRRSFDVKIAGVIRTTQNWIGGNDYNPLDARFVPPPPELVPALLEDLCAFMARDDLPAVAQAAIAHAQFETIHPFADGNGRVGRALISTVLRRTGEWAGFAPPISLVFGRRKQTYIAGLENYRDGGLDAWCTLFAGATTQAAVDAERLAAEVEALETEWIERLGHPRADAASRQIVAALPAHPVIDVKAAQEITGKSHVAVGKALVALERAGIVAPLAERRWGRVWECGELLDLVTEFEASLLA